MTLLLQLRHGSPEPGRHSQIQHWRKLDHVFHLHCLYATILHACSHYGPLGWSFLSQYDSDDQWNWRCILLSIQPQDVSGRGFYAVIWAHILFKTLNTFFALHKMPRLKCTMIGLSKSIPACKNSIGASLWGWCSQAGSWTAGLKSNRMSSIIYSVSIYLTNLYLG